MKIKTIIFVISLIFGIGLFVIQFLHTGIDQFLHALKEFSLLKFIIFVAISFINFYLFSIRWKMVIDALHKGKPVSTMACFLDRMAGYAVSYVTPVAQLGGEPLRLMLIEEEGVPKRTAVSSIIIEKALEISTMVLFISMGIVIAILEPAVSIQTKLPLGLIALLMIFGVFWFYFTSFRGIGFFTSISKILHLGKIRRLELMEKKLETFEKEMNLFYKNHRSIFKYLVVLCIITVGVILAEHFLVAYFMGVQLNFLQTFMISTIPYIAYLLPIPGGLGVLEGGAASVFLLHGININSLAYVFIIRLRDFIFVLMGLVRGSQKGISIMKKEFQNEFK